MDNYKSEIVNEKIPEEDEEGKIDGHGTPHKSLVGITVHFTLASLHTTAPWHGCLFLIKKKP